jgi:toxin HigB-1
MIVSYRSRDIQRFAEDGKCPARWRAIEKIVLRKLDMIKAAGELRDLANPPGNRLERLHGDRAGQHSIRINDQWRICFTWTPAGAANVEIVDYH